MSTALLTWDVLGHSCWYTSETHYIHYISCLYKRPERLILILITSSHTTYPTMSNRPTTDRSTSDSAVRTSPISSPVEQILTQPESAALNSSTDSSTELAQVVDDLLTQLNNKFTTVSSELLTKSTHEHLDIGSYHSSDIKLSGRNVKKA